MNGQYQSKKEGVNYTGDRKLADLLERNALEDTNEEIKIQPPGGNNKDVQVLPPEQAPSAKILK